jgi:protein TorT
MRQVFVGLVAVSVLAGAGQARATDWKYPVINVIGGNDVRGDWTPLPKNNITKPWHVCVLLPNMKDPYWLSVDYGLVAEARRDNINLQTYEAGGYAHLATQLNQFDDCIAQKYDAILVAAINANGVSAEVNKAVTHGIAVIDLANGINDPHVSAHSLMPFSKMGEAAGKYLVNLVKGKPTTVAFLPGPQGAGFSDDTVTGFKAAIAGHSNIKISSMPRGDLGTNIQLNLVEGALQADPSINYVVALNTGAIAATIAVRSADIAKRVKIISIGVEPQVYADVKKGTIIAAVSDSPVAWSRIGIDMAVRLVEKQSMPATRSGPVPQILVTGHDNRALASLTLAPKDFRATFSINAK